MFSALKRSLVACCALSAVLLSTTSSFAAITPPAEAEQTYSIVALAASGNYFYVQVDRPIALGMNGKVPVPNNCHASMKDRFAFPADMEGSAGVQSLLLAAFLSGRKVNFTHDLSSSGDNACHGWARSFTYVRTAN
jgi:hypothetical protein